MLRSSAVEHIELWADEAEGGNYHAFAACLSVYAEVIRERRGPECLLLIKSIDEFDPKNNLIEMVIEDE